MRKTDQTIEDLEREFNKRRWIIAFMNMKQLKKFIEDLNYDFDTKKLPPIESSVRLGNHGGLYYFSDEGAVVIASNRPSDLPKYEKYLRTEIIKWLIRNDIEWDFS